GTLLGEDFEIVVQEGSLLEIFSKRNPPPQPKEQMSRPRFRTKYHGKVGFAFFDTVEGLVGDAADSFLAHLAPLLEEPGTTLVNIQRIGHLPGLFNVAYMATLSFERPKEPS